MTKSPSRVAIFAGLLTVGLAVPSRADFGVNLSFNDASGTYASYYNQISAGVTAAAADWSSHIANTSGAIRLQVNFTNESTASAGSYSTHYVGTDGAINVFEQGALAHVTNGYTDPNSPYDAVLNIGAAYLTNTLWFDPNPSQRTAAIPANRVDAQSVFLHEIGHMLVFNGFRNLTNGTLPGNYESTFDRSTTFDGTNYYFNGPNATAVYGGAVPLTYGNIFHVGNASPRPGSNLIPDLMNGVVYYYQNRYSISALDLAMAADTGIRLNAVPEPGSIVLVGIGLVVAIGARRVRAKVAA